MSWGFAALWWRIVVGMDPVKRAPVSLDRVDTAV